LYCPNKDCSKRAYHRLQKWIKKLGVKNFGELILKQLFDSGKVQNIADLYSLKTSDLSKLNRVGEKSAQKALDNLLAVKQISLAKFVGGFDLENIGESLVENVVDAGLDTLEKVRNATVHDLKRVELFADITANKFHTEFNALYFDMLEVLKTNKIKLREVKTTGDKLKGLSFCFTGTLENFKPRSKAEETVIENGGIVKNGVTKDLSFLVTNSDEPTKKYETAQSQENTKIISEEEYLKMIEE